MTARFATTLLGTLVSVGLAVLLWEVLIDSSGVTHYIAKGPVDVYDYLLLEPGAAQNRSELLAALETTVRDAAVGLAAGSFAAVFLAMLFTLRHEVEQSFMPVALALRTVPLVAMVPVIVLAFGRGAGNVGAICGIVVFFPTLVNVTLAMRAAPRELVDVMNVQGAASLTTLRKVRIPWAVPALFASIRIATPLAFGGAVLAEWLSTGQGLGNLIVSSIATSDYSRSWAAVFIVIVVSIIFHRLIAATETVVLERMGLGGGADPSAVARALAALRSEPAGPQLGMAPSVGEVRAELLVPDRE